MRSLGVLLIGLAVIASISVYAGVPSPYQSHEPLPALTGNEPVRADFVSETRNAVLSLDEPIGNVYAAGTTWYDLQHNGSAGKMIGVDNGGWVHVAWMKGWEAANTYRHVYYNVWDPTTQQMELAGGSQIDASARAGYVCQGVTAGGWAFPGFHWLEGNINRTGSAIDFLPRIGAFTMFAANFNNQPFIWPKIAVDRDSLLHVISTQNALNSFAFFYSRGTPEWDSGEFGININWQAVGGGGAEFLLMDTAAFVSADIAASKVSDRVAMAWTKQRPGGNEYSLNDVFYWVSDDGGVNWGAVINLTQFALEDTHRAYVDVSLVFDDQDFLQIAFTSLHVDEPNQLAYVQESMIWHWDEQHNQFSALAEAWYYNLNGSPGGNMLNVNRPSLSIDPVTGFLYCSYQKFDTAYVSQNGYFNADAWVTVSTDGGVHWSVGRNVTDTHPNQNPEPPGESRSERDITLADRVTYSGGTGYLHLEWELDLDAGTAVLPAPEGMATQNTIFYQRIPVDEIPHSPLMPWYPLHVGQTPQCACHDEPNTHCADVDADIPDGDYDGIQVLVDVPIQYHITDVNVCLDIVHEYVGDLAIELISPMGTHVPLVEYSVYGANLTCTNFDDEAALYIYQGSPPYTGSFRPMGLLSAFDGENAVGDWRLHVVDTVQFGFGYINWVCVSFDYDYILPVELSSFDAVAEAEGIRINFQTASETDNDHFEIMRGGSAEGEFARIASLTSEGSSSGHAYSYLDDNVTIGETYWYYLVDVSLMNERTEHRDLMRSATFTGAELPVEYSLAAYPNPFNPVTTLTFGIAEEGIVRLEMFNVSGQRVREFVNRRMEAGNHTVLFDAKELPSGVYFAKIEVNDFVKAEKMVLLK